MSQASSPLRILLLLMFSALPSSAQAKPPLENRSMVEVKSGKKVIVGHPLGKHGNKLDLLRPTGRVSTVSIADDRAYRFLREPFKPISSAELRQQLRKEFGRKYHVSVTGHFVVVHPDGNFSKWATPFEKLYQRFRAYFLMRGHALEEPEFPMVAVVLKTRAEFDWFLRRYQKFPGQEKNVLGYYSPRSNRIITYAASVELKESEKSIFDADTLVHEAAHQAAYNTGIHSRFGRDPRWLVEGLAMLLEAPGIDQSRFKRNQSQRINQGRLGELLMHYQRGNIQGKISEMIRTDQFFRSAEAYPLAWGLTFYLSEVQPKAYHRYLQANAKGGENGKPLDRHSAFSHAFGNDIDRLESDMKQFFQKLAKENPVGN